LVFKEIYRITTDANMGSQGWQGEFLWGYRLSSELADYLREIHGALQCSQR
jgi:hypothetical protein